MADLVVLGDIDLTRVFVFFPDQYPEESAFAVAVPTDNTETLARLKREGNLFEQQLCAVAFL